MKQNHEEYNWAGNYRYRAPHIARPESIQELQRLVVNSLRIRALGSRHSFNDIADSAGTLVSLERLEPEIRIDPQAKTVTVSGGTSYGTLATELHRQGFALHNLASLPHISVAGAIATGTHGSGDSNGNLASCVAGLEFVDADGQLVDVRRGDPDFSGMVVSLGALGIVTRVILDILPSFNVSQTVLENLEWDKVLPEFTTLTSSAYSVSLFTDWCGDFIGQTWLKRREADPSPQASILSTFGGRAASKPLHPLPEADGTICTTQLGHSGPWADRLAHFRMDFTPSAGDELQSEYLIPREHAVAALQAMRQLSPVISPLLLISEVRTIAADSLWLSPNYQREAIALHFTWRPAETEVRAVLPIIEQALGSFQARPHWGKLFTSNQSQLAAAYPRFEDFIDLATRLDPQGKFRNEFLERSIFSG